MEKIFRENELIPDMIDSGPETQLKITYENGVEVDAGKELTAFQVKSEPKVEWKWEPNTYYTLIMTGNEQLPMLCNCSPPVRIFYNPTDLDAISRVNPNYREVSHWIIGNILENDIKNGNIIHEFVGSGPFPDTGLHRYVTLVFKQNTGKIEFNEPPLTSIEQRMHFSTRKFAKKYSLGNPYAGNFYQTQYDDYVRMVHEQHNVDMTKFM